jgi:type IV pilus assembly protein PilE
MRPSHTQTPSPKVCPRHGKGPLRTRQKGWTLAELMVTLGLMSILAALALPTYQQQQRQSRRTDGQAALLQLQVDQARWRSSHGQYANTVTDLGWASDLSARGHYQISISEATADTYTAHATAMGDQNADRACTPLHLRWQDSATAVWGAGEHAHSDPNRCWRR